MKNAIHVFQSLILLLICGCMFGACGDDKDDPSINNGPSRKLLSITSTSEWGTYTQYANPKWENGRLISFQDGNDADDVYSIRYGGSTASIYSGSDADNPFLFTLNKDGYAINFSEGYELSYENGYLTSWNTINNGSTTYTEYCNITYDNGDITKVEKYSGPYSSQNGTRVFAYTDSEVSSPIPNVGHIMLMSDWYIMWDYEYFYWFGIYGKAIAHLPVRVGDSTFKWELDNQGYPVKCVVTEKTIHYNVSQPVPVIETTTYNFTWE